MAELNSPHEGSSMLDLRRDIDDLGQRISRLEKSSAQRDFPGGLDASATNTATAPNSTSIAVDAILRMNSATYCAMALTEAHEALIRRDIARQSGEESLALELDENIAGLICITMNRVVDEFSIPANINLSEADPWLFNSPLERLQELQVLQLAGLAPWLAERHLDAALDLIGSVNRVTTEAEVVRALQSVELSACATHQRLGRERKSRELDQRKAANRRRMVRRLMFGLGAATIVVANGTVIAAMPVIAPASMALGGGAAGSLANLIEY